MEGLGETSTISPGFNVGSVTTVTSLPGPTTTASPVFGLVSTTMPVGLGDGLGETSTEGVT
jgi:hypothetical protein